MKKEYDFSNGVRGKFFRKTKVQRTLRLDADILIFFQELSANVGIPYQTLINLSLRKFAVEDAVLNIKATKKTKV